MGLKSWQIDFFTQDHSTERAIICVLLHLRKAFAFTWIYHLLLMQSLTQEQIFSFGINQWHFCYCVLWSRLDQVLVLWTILLNIYLVLMVCRRGCFDTLNKGAHITTKTIKMSCYESQQQVSPLQIYNNLPLNCLIFVCSNSILNYWPQCHNVLFP